MWCRGVKREKVDLFTGRGGLVAMVAKAWKVLRTGVLMRGCPIEGLDLFRQESLRRGYSSTWRLEGCQ